MIEVLLVLMVAGLAGYAVHLRDLINRCDQRIDRANKAIQTEGAERGKLSRRIAQAETKIAKRLVMRPKGS